MYLEKLQSILLNKPHPFFPCFWLDVLNSQRVPEFGQKSECPYTNVATLIANKWIAEVYEDRLE